VVGRVSRGFHSADREVCAAIGPRM